MISLTLCPAEILKPLQRVTASLLPTVCGVTLEQFGCLHVASSACKYPRHLRGLGRGDEELLETSILCCAVGARRDSPGGT